ncbi:septation ring formation regulator EzrA [Vagococcus acidifermentans]|uniref:Septation ring formation regulator EzrA n=1 Tax=Vagococcus acidifermentans TaxID=564710 RepID=A0A430AQ31_9ENTE|nr:septation ring formation regulator EzrA [Vagococcus acidifermentans]RSU10250.1 septation ring formation regulator EzrA [Vagococcus acidifermentans]
MEPNIVLWILLGVIVVAAVLYLIAFLLKKKNLERLQELEERKTTLFDLPVLDEVDEVKKMHLVGQSQNTFREWNQKWVDLSTISFAELESRIFEVENLNDTFRFMKVKTALDEANQTMTEMETEVETIRDGLKDLRESEARNSEAVQEALDLYHQISEEVVSEEEKYGNAFKELEKQIKSIDRDFSQFMALNTAGDPMEARVVLDQAEEKTYAIQKTVERIPPQFETLDTVFPEQLKEIKEGYETLKKDNYVFEEDDIDERVEKLEEKIRSTLLDLEKLEVDAVERANKETAKDIDKLYDIMEKEISAKRYVIENKDNLLGFLSHANKNNRQLMIELDHISQSYILNNNELGVTRGFQALMDEIKKTYESYNEKLESNEAVFSKVAKFYEESLAQLEEIEEQQVAIDRGVKELNVREHRAVQKIDDYELELRNIRRFVEKQRLPGIPNSYLEFFFVTSERVEDLADELNKIRIDMNYIDNLVRACDEDIAILREKSNSLVDDAALTEQMIQHANRFRFSHPEIKNAIDRSLSLFSREHRYSDALDVIAAELERIEPGVTARIRTFYQNNRDDIL